MGLQFHSRILDIDNIDVSVLNALGGALGTPALSRVFVALTAGVLPLAAPAFAISADRGNVTPTAAARGLGKTVKPFGTFRESF